MATELKFVQFFGSLSGYGWSEVHYRLSSTDTPNLEQQLQAFFANVGLARKELLGQDCITLGARVSYPRNGAVASKQIKQAERGNLVQPGASWSSSLAVNFCDTTNTKNKTCHLRGFWDSVEHDEFYDPNQPGAAGWTDRLNAWKTALIDGSYGWLSKDPAKSAKGNVTNYVVAATNIVTFTLDGVGMPAPLVGTVQQVRFSKLNRSNSVLNKPILVTVTAQNTLTSVYPIAAGAFISKGRYNFRGVTFVPYNGTNGITLGKRAMGKPIGHSPARSKARPLT